MTSTEPTMSKEKMFSATIARSAFRDAIGKLVPLVDGGRMALPVSKSVLVVVTADGLDLSGTDFNAFVRVSLRCSVTGGGKALLPAKRLAEIAANLPDGALITLVAAKDRATITAGRAEFVIPGLDPKEFPQFPAVAGTPAMVNARRFVDAVTRIVKLAGNQPSRTPLHAVRVANEDGRAVAVATSGSVLGRMPLTDSGELPEMSLHSGSVPLLSRLFGSLTADDSLSLTADDSRLVIASDEVTAVLPFNAELYPNYLQVLAHEPEHAIVCDRAELLAAIARVNVITGENERVRCTINGDLSLSSAHEDGRAQDVVTLESHTGDGEITVFMNAGFMRSALTTLTHERVAVTIQSPERAVHFRNADQLPADPTLVLVMPLRGN
jgi:DNA polymerase-3 subunit beta